MNVTKYLINKRTNYKFQIGDSESYDLDASQIYGSGINIEKAIEGLVISKEQIEEYKRFGINGIYEIKLHLEITSCIEEIRRIRLKPNATLLDLEVDSNQ